MKRYLLLCFLAALSMTGYASITLEADPATLTFTGTNFDNNYRFVLSPYEMSDNGGPQFQLVVSRIDAGKPAQFTADDLADENYWEPMFKYYTSMLAGEEMSVQDNLKRLYLGDVQLQPKQFFDYNELHIIGFDLSADYMLPEGCFLFAGSHLETVSVNSPASMTLGANSLPVDKAFVVNVNSAVLQQVWEAYKSLYGCQYTVNYDGAEAGITSLAVTINMGGPDEQQVLPAAGMPDIDLTEGGTNAENAFVLKGFSATTSGEVTSVCLKGTVYQVGSSPDEWHSIDAQQVSAGIWQANGLNIDFTEGLSPGKQYVLELYCLARNGNQDYYYNNGGGNYKVIFMVSDGTSTPEVVFYDQNTAGLGLNVDGNVINFVLNGDGTKTPDGYLGIIRSLAIESFYVRCQRATGVNLNDVSLQWRLTNDSGDVLTAWNRIDFQRQQDEGGDKYKKYFEATGLYENVSALCVAGSKYILEVMYQLINSGNGNYYFFARDEEVGRFRFAISSAGVTGDVDGNGIVDVADLNLIINIILGEDQADNYNGRADVDPNGLVDIADLNAIINIILGQ